MSGQTISGPITDQTITDQINSLTANYNWWQKIKVIFWKFMIKYYTPFWSKIVNKIYDNYTLNDFHNRKMFVYQADYLFGFIDYILSIENIDKRRTGDCDELAVMTKYLMTKQYDTNNANKKIYFELNPPQFYHLKYTNEKVTDVRTTDVRTTDVTTTDVRTTDVRTTDVRGVFDYMKDPKSDSGSIYINKLQVMISNLKNQTHPKPIDPNAYTNPKIYFAKNNDGMIFGTAHIICVAKIKTTEIQTNSNKYAWTEVRGFNIGTNNNPWPDEARLPNNDNILLLYEGTFDDLQHYLSSFAGFYSKNDLIMFETDI